MEQALSLAERYLALLKKSLLNELYLESEAGIAYLAQHAVLKTFPPISQAISEFLRIHENQLYQLIADARTEGGSLLLGHLDTANQVVQIPGLQNFFFTSHSMIGRARMDNIHYCLDAITADNIPGDLIETGVWKGGATIFMRGYLAAHNVRNRRVWVADSFEGLPKPTHEKDMDWDISKEICPYLSVSIEEVQRLFDRYDLLDEQVCFLKGWFSDTLPNAPIGQLALLRLDGDLYESTMDGLVNLYAKLSPGGFVIVDDYNALPQCKDAVHDFRIRHGITEEIIQIDHASVYWRKSRTGTAASSKMSPESGIQVEGNACDPHSPFSLLKLLFGRQKK